MLPRLSYCNMLSPTTFFRTRKALSDCLLYHLDFRFYRFTFPTHVSGMSGPQPTLPYKIWKGWLWHGQTVTRPILSCTFGIAQDMKSHLLVCQTDSYPTHPKANRSLLYQPIIPFILIKHFRNPICPHRSDFGLQRSIIVS